MQVAAAAAAAGDEDRSREGRWGGEGEGKYRDCCFVFQESSSEGGYFAGVFLGRIFSVEAELFLMVHGGAVENVGDAIEAEDLGDAEFGVEAGGELAEEDGVDGGAAFGAVGAVEAGTLAGVAVAAADGDRFAVPVGQVVEDGADVFGGGALAS